MSLHDKTLELCKINNITPARSKGQNFLIEEDFYNKIIETADLKEDDIVLEVGPGLGFLTEKLAQKVKQVITVELDDKLASLLKIRLKKEKIENVEVVNENILDCSIKYQVLSIKDEGIENEKNIHNTLYIIPNTNYKIVANLPYNITSVFLRKFLSGEGKPELMVLMLQKEVAERIVARAGEMSMLAVSVQFYADAEIVANVPANAFWPAPKVDSAIIKLRIKNYELRIKGNENREKENLIPDTRYEIRDISVDKERDFFRMVKFGFSAKRKMLKNNLAGGYHIKTEITENWLKLAGFNPMIRAQELGINDWIKLFEVIQENML